MTDEPTFSLDLMVPAERHAVVTVAGELDMLRAPALETVLDRIVDQGARQVIVDLDEVDFIDSTGIRVIVCAAARLHKAGGSLRLVYSDANVQRLFEILTLDRVVGTYQCRRMAHGSPRSAEGAGPDERR